jgi:phosphoribosylglycinamide formyltransferase-1
VVNIHPALPGQFPGTHAIERALSAAQRLGLNRTGVMVHYVPDEGVDDGPVIASVEVPIRTDDDLESLTERVHAAEHALVVSALRQLTERRGWRALR